MRLKIALITLLKIFLQKKIFKKLMNKSLLGILMRLKNKRIITLHFLRLRHKIILDKV